MNPLRFITALPLLLACFAVLAGGPVEQASPDAEIAKSESAEAAAASAELRQRLEGLDSLAARFEQTVADADGYQIQAVSGKMTVARPGLIHWQTDPPYEQLLVADAETLWLYDRDLEQVTVRPFLRDIADSPAMLFVGDISEMDEKYTVTRSGEEGAETFTLVPRNDSAVYRRLSLTFDGRKPVAMALWDSLGQVTRIRFAEVELNRPVDPALFRFDIPEGVDVLHND